MIENRQPARKRRRLVPGQIPDPLGAHGAWVYLAVSVLAGMATAPAWQPALLVGAGSVGLFVLSSALAIAGRGATLARLGLGLLLTIGSAFGALYLEADGSFLLVSLGAIPPILIAAWFAGRQGFLSPGALAFGVTALAVVAPAVATAGGVPLRTALLLMAALAPFFFWRTWRLARVIGQGWTRERFARRGLVESGFVMAWATVVVAAIRILL